MLNQLLVFSLLTLAGLYDEPFYVTTETNIELEITEKLADILQIFKKKFPNLYLKIWKEINYDHAN